ERAHGRVPFPKGDARGPPAHMVPRPRHAWQAALACAAGTSILICNRRGAPSMSHDVCVIYNPASGKGRGRDRLERLRRALGGRAEFRPTRHPGDGEALALDAAGDGFATVVAAGGDGTVHEVANGLLRSGRRDVTLAV